MVVLLTRVCAVLHPRRAQGLESILVASMCRYRTIILGGASRLAIARGGGGRVSEVGAARCSRSSQSETGVQALEKRDYEIQTSLHNATCIRASVRSPHPLPDLPFSSLAWQSLPTCHSLLVFCSLNFAISFLSRSPAGSPRISSPVSCMSSLQTTLSR
jgi:hypothetical protein